MMAENERHPASWWGSTARLWPGRRFAGAVRQAELTGASIDAVLAWHYPAAATGGFGSCGRAVGP
jgi:hypothetical protein